jgi:hypothetical protein
LDHFGAARVAIGGVGLLMIGDLTKLGYDIAAPSARLADVHAAIRTPTL